MLAYMAGTSGVFSLVFDICGCLAVTHNLHIGNTIVLTFLSLCNIGQQSGHMCLLNMKHESPNISLSGSYIL